MLQSSPPPSTTRRLDSTVDTPVLVASTVDSDVIDASVASSVESRTTMTDGLVVEISEFKELLSYGEDFACRRHVSIVQRWSATRDKTKRLQKGRSGADVFKSSLSPPTCGTKPVPAQSPQPPSTSLPSSAPVPGAAPPSTSGKMRRSSKFTQERRPYPTSRQLPFSKSPSSSGEDIQQQLSVLTETVVQQQATSVICPRAGTSNRFAVLRDEVADLDDLAKTVIDPLVSPSPKGHPVTSGAAPSNSAEATPVCNTPPAQVSSESGGGGAGRVSC